jgi:hypothetical protein
VVLVMSLLNALPFLSSIVPPNALMEFVLLPSELLEMLALLLPTVLLEFAPILDVLEKLTEQLALALMNADLDLIAMELAWPPTLLELLAPVETNAVNLETATTELVDSSTLEPLDQSAMTLLLACLELTVELDTPALPTLLPSLVIPMRTALQLELIPSVCAMLLEPKLALKEMVSLLTVPPLSPPS